MLFLHLSLWLRKCWGKKKRKTHCETLQFLTSLSKSLIEAKWLKRGVFRRIYYVSQLTIINENKGRTEQAVPLLLPLTARRHRLPLVAYQTQISLSTLTMIYCQIPTESAICCSTFGVDSPSINPCIL